MAVSQLYSRSDQCRGGSGAGTVGVRRLTRATAAVGEDDRRDGEGDRDRQFGRRWQGRQRRPAGVAGDVGAGVRGSRIAAKRTARNRRVGTIEERGGGVGLREVEEE